MSPGQPGQPGRPVRVAVVGVGHLGSLHARIFHASPEAELVAVVDADAERARRLAAELGCRALEHSAALAGGVEAVSIAVPTRRHAEVAVPLLEAGIPALIEKPLADSLEAADRILAAARRGGAAVAVGHVERFQPGVRKVRELGLEPRFIECHRLAPFSFRSTDVGVVHDLMIHDLDLVLDLVGSEVESLDAAGGAILTEHEDVASVRLVFADGSRANVTASRASLQPMRRFRLFSRQGYVSLDFTSNRGLYVRKGERWREALEELGRLDPAQLAGMADRMTGGGMLEALELELQGAERPLQAELASFLRCVREHRPPEVSGEDGRRALALADRIARAIGEQRW